MKTGSRDGACSDIRTRLHVRPSFLLAVGCVLAGFCPAVFGVASADEGEVSADALYEQYRAVVERNIFSQFARSPRPAPVPRAERTADQTPRARVPSDPAALHVLSGVVTGGDALVALIEGTATRETRAYGVGGETPGGRVLAIDVDGVTLVSGERRLRILVGYTLSGERSGKLTETVSSLGGSTSRGSARRTPDRGRQTAAGERPSAAPRLPDERRNEIIRRMREARQRQLGGTEPEGQ